MLPNRENGVSNPNKPEDTDILGDYPLFSAPLILIPFPGSVLICSTRVLWKWSSGLLKNIRPCSFRNILTLNRPGYKPLPGVEKNWTH